MTIVVTKFGPEIPKVHRRMLPVNAASLAVNAQFDDISARPFNAAVQRYNFNAPIASFYNEGTEWLAWDSVVSVTKGAVAQDRLYITGDGPPKLRVAGVECPLALPAPAAAPTVTNASAPSSVIEMVIWCYTWVTSFGEESEPSPLSAPTASAPAIEQTITGFATPPSGRAITAIRLYRSQTSVSGATDLFFAKEIAIGTASTTFTLGTASVLGESIKTKGYTPPIDTLQGLISMPNGMMAAFSGNEVFFCEPYRHHAWPAEYALAVDNDIVGLAAFGSNLAILTRGAPYVAQGLHPSSMRMEKLEAGSPCLSRRGIVDLGYAALYPSVDGLMMISGGQVVNVTASVFSREQWTYMGPETMLAARFGSGYLFSRAVLRYTTYDAGFALPWPTYDVDFDLPPAAIPSPSSDYVIYDLGNASSGFAERRMGIVEMSPSGAIGFVDTNVSDPTHIFQNQIEMATYFSDSGGAIYEWGPDAQTNTSEMTMTWRSKTFSFSQPVAYGAAFIRTARPIRQGDQFKVRVICDDINIHEITKANSIQRLPSKAGLEWQFEIETNLAVVMVVIGHDPDSVAAQVVQ
jgi:hypothetical protein